MGTHSGSKKLAEQAAWEFTKTTAGVNFSLATINPPMVYGPPFAGSANLRHLGQSASEIYALMNGSATAVPPTTLPAFVDVRDVAKAHRLAFETDQPQRFLVSGGSFDMQQVCDLLRENIPKLKSRVPIGNPGHASVGEHYQIDSSKARNVLGIEFLPFSSTFLDMANTFMQLEELEKTPVSV